MTSTYTHTQHTCVQYIPNPVTGTTLGVTISGHTAVSLCRGHCTLPSQQSHRQNYAFLTSDPDVAHWKQPIRWLCLECTHTHTYVYLKYLSICPFTPSCMLSHLHYKTSSRSAVYMLTAGETNATIPHSRLYYISTILTQSHKRTLNFMNLPSQPQQQYTFLFQ